jgi:mono/diheme cytochrome c family protein
MVWRDGNTNESLEYVSIELSEFSTKWRLTMNSLSTRSAVLLTTLLLSSMTVAMAQEGQKTIKRGAPAPVTSAASGEEMFKTYCAVCHGKDGKGDGPAASEFKIPPANLTLLSVNNNGKFPADHVAETIRTGPRDAKAHGSKDMPVWGPVFASMGGTGQVEQRIRNLTKYVESLQAK